MPTVVRTTIAWCSQHYITLWCNSHIVTSCIRVWRSFERHTLNHHLSSDEAGTQPKRVTTQLSLPVWVDILCLIYIILQGTSWQQYEIIFMAMSVWEMGSAQTVLSKYIWSTGNGIMTFSQHTWRSIVFVQPSINWVYH